MDGETPGGATEDLTGTGYAATASTASRIDAATASKKFSRIDPI
jgi:hypothetical protein